MRTNAVLAGLALVVGLVVVPACSSSSGTRGKTCHNGVRDGDETGIDCGGSCDPCHHDGPGGDKGNPCDTPGECADGEGCATDADCITGYCEAGACAVPRSDDGVKNGSETDVDCGGPDAPTCAEGKSCLVDTDCHAACNYANKCVDAPSCKPHLGGDTCGPGEVGQPSVTHESCCRSLPVTGYTDPRYPDKTVYLDKYEITTGRIRAFLTDIAARHDGRPDVKAWVADDPPPIWDDAWNRFLPSDHDGEKVRVERRLLGDRRGGPGAPVVPDRDVDVETGTDFQFNGRLFVYLHGNNCSTHVPGAYGFPTFFYPPEVLAKMGEDLFPPRASGRTFAGGTVAASEHLEVKAMNCITNAMLAAFCHWDGGQLATNEVLDYVTDSPKELGDMPGCGTQIGTEYPPESSAATKGGRCAPLAFVNATFDAGGALPVPNSPLNANNYEYPFFDSSVTHDKAWEVAAPGRGSLAAGGEPIDMVRIHPGDEPWMDLHGNLNEAVLTMDGPRFTGKFGIKFRGIGYQSARSELNFRSDWEGEGGIRRIERAEAKAGFTGGRCMRFK